MTCRVLHGQHLNLTALASLLAIVVVAEVGESTDLEQVVLDVLHHTRGAILHEVVHDGESLEDAPPVLGLALDFLPHMLHDHVVVVPVVGVVGQNLQFAVANGPVLIAGALRENLAILGLLEHAAFALAASD